MDRLRRIEIEAMKIKSAISEYTGEGQILTTLDLLFEAIKKGDRDEVLYHFRDMGKWYQANLSKIRRNQFVDNFQEHQENVDSITQIIDELGNLDEPLGLREENESEESLNKIFISHASGDKNIVDLLVNEVKNLNVEIVYTSQPSMNPSISGEDFIIKILEGIKESRQVLACLSPNFYKSVVCQVEMGMAYALGKQIKPIIISTEPNYKENLQGVFHSNTKVDHLYLEDQLWKSVV